MWPLTHDEELLLAGGSERPSFCGNEAQRTGTRHDGGRKAATRTEVVCFLLSDGHISLIFTSSIFLNFDLSFRTENVGLKYLNLSFC